MVPGLEERLFSSEEDDILRIAELVSCHHTQPCHVID
jgi:hypothetical protein